MLCMARPSFGNGHNQGLLQHDPGGFWHFVLKELYPQNYTDHVPKAVGLNYPEPSNNYWQTHLFAFAFFCSCIFYSHFCFLLSLLSVSFMKTLTWFCYFRWLQEVPMDFAPPWSRNNAYNWINSVKVIEHQLHFRPKHREAKMTTFFIQQKITVKEEWCGAHSSSDKGGFEMPK